MGKWDASHGRQTGCERNCALDFSTAISDLMPRVPDGGVPIAKFIATDEERSTRLDTGGASSADGRRRKLEMRLINTEIMVCQNFGVQLQVDCFIIGDTEL